MLGDPPSATGQTSSTLTIPIVVGDRRVGTLLITRTLDDFSALSHEAFLSRLIATLGVFAVGILLSLYLVVVPQPAAPGAHGRRPQGGRGRPLGAGASSTAATRSPASRAPSTRWWSGCARTAGSRSGCTSRSAPPPSGRLASAVAHEIRNPLNFINLSIDHVRQRMAPEESARRDDFDRILADDEGRDQPAQPAGRRLPLLRQADAARPAPLRRGRGRCARSPRSWTTRPRTRASRSTVDAEPDLPRVVVDPELLKTCFLNLMINAVDAMPEGGLLSVSIRRGDERRPARALHRGHGHGQGHERRRRSAPPSSPTSRPRTPGSASASPSPTRSWPTTAAAIALESAPGRGTTARITLPLEPHAPRKRTASPAEVVRRMKPRILVVDDEPHQRDILQMILEAEGYERHGGGQRPPGPARRRATAPSTWCSPTSRCPTRAASSC